MSSLDLSINMIARASEVGEALTQLKLQKLLYYVQGWALALEGAPRFTDVLEAWEFGPVVYALRQKYGTHGRTPLPLPDPLPELMDDALLDTVLEVYGAHEAEQLIALTHLERPWRQTYKPFQHRLVIPNDLVAEYFRQDAVRDFDIHGQFLDAWRARKHDVVAWSPQAQLGKEDVKRLEAEFG